MAENIEVELLETGTVVGDGFRIVGPPAEGGMGTIYEVEQIATGERRSLEVIVGPFRSDAGLRARFVREMRLAASIPNEHVARMVDAGQDQATGALYVVMELLDGSTLARALQSHGPFPWTSAIVTLGHIADALRAAHARGIVHRALSPASVFLTHARDAHAPFTVKLLDFGIAKAFSPSAGVPSAVGEPAWTAPELGALAGVGGAIGPQADVWALGLLAFALLTGKHYFTSANVESAPADVILREVTVHDLVPASDRAAQLGEGDRLPAHFDAWFARCTHPDPQARFDDVQSAYEALAGLPRPASVEPPAFELFKKPPPPPAPETSTRSRALVTVAVPEPPQPAMRARWVGPTLVGIAGLVGVAMALLITWGTHGANPVLAAAAAQAPTRVVLRMHGSNTIGAVLAPALADAFLRRRTGAKTVALRRTAPDELLVEARDGADTLEAIEIAAHGSSTAFADLGAGLCDIGMASRRIHDDEVANLGKLGDLASAASEHVIALDGIAIIVNPSNPVSSLTKTQIADIFRGNFLLWSQVDGKHQPIVVHARDDNSGTYDTFKHLVLAGHELSAEAKRHESSDELSDAVAADPAAIGFIGLPYIRSAKAVMVQDQGSVPLLPSPMTVSTEDYPLARRLYLYLALGAPVVAHDFVDFAQSEEGQKVVATAGFVDLRPECDPNASRCASCTARYRELVSGACRLSTDFRFDRGNAQLDTRALRDLTRVGAMMERPEYVTKSIVLLGFSDASGARADNLVLSQERAAVVATQLRARGVHVDVERGFGADMPVSDNATQEGRERNRRVEVWLH